MEKDIFINRLVKLRIEKGVSARDMSLSIGQSAGYINNVENGINYPSMQTFFYMCEYLGISPAEFFDTDNKSPEKLRELIEYAQHLNANDLEHITAIVKALNQRMR